MASYQESINRMAVAIDTATGGRGLVNAPSSVVLPLLSRLARELRADPSGFGIALRELPANAQEEPHYIFCNILAMSPMELCAFTFGSLIDALPMSREKSLILAPYPLPPGLPQIDFVRLATLLATAYNPGTVPAGRAGMLANTANAVTLARAEIARLPNNTWARILSGNGLYMNPAEKRPALEIILNRSVQFMDAPTFLLSALIRESAGSLNVKPPPALNFLLELRDGDRYANNLLRMQKAIIAQNDARLAGTMKDNGTPLYVPRYSNSSADLAQNIAGGLLLGAVALPAAATLGAVMGVGNAVLIGIGQTVLAPIAAGVYYVVAAVYAYAVEVAASLSVGAAKDAATQKADEKLREETRDAVASAFQPDAPSAFPPAPVAIPPQAIPAGPAAQPPTTKSGGGGIVLAVLSGLLFFS